MPRVEPRGILAATPPGEAVDHPPAKPAGPLARAMVGSPELLAAAVAGFSVGPMILLLAGHFTAALALPAGLAGAILAVWCCGIPAGPVSRVDVRYTLAAFAAAAGWVGYNVQYTAQDVYATRDPATYTITARWLVDHGSLQIHTHPEIFGSPPGGVVESGSYAHISGDVVNAQGNHLLSALLACSAWVFGDGAIFTTNVVLSGLALLVFFGLARRIVGVRLALAAMATLAVSMPMIYVARDTYTEPLTLLFLTGSLAMVHRAFASRRPADFALAGMIGGCAAMVRIDAYGALIALVAAAVAVACVGPDARRRGGYVSALALLLGAGATTLLGWLDLAKLARQYYDSQHHNIMLLLSALGVAVLAAPVVVWVAAHDRVRAVLGAERVRARLTLAAGGLIVASFAVLASRPAWSTTRGARNLNLENMQRRWGAPVDGTRTYHEQTVHWLSLYLGWPTVALAVVGYVLLVAAVVRRRAFGTLAALTMGLMMSALYLWTPQIAPDQPWAMRRYVPVVIPLLLVAAMAGLQALMRWERGRSVGRAVVVLASAYVVVFAAQVSWPMRHVREEVPQLRQVRAICAAIGSRGAVLEVDDNAVFGYGQTLRAFCNVPTIGLSAAAPDQLAAVRRAVAAHGRVLYVLSQDPARATYADGVQAGAFSTVTVQRWPTQINVAPDEPDQQTYTMFLSTVDDRGFAHPVTAPGG